MLPRVHIVRSLLVYMAEEKKKKERKLVSKWRELELPSRVTIGFILRAFRARDRKKSQASSLRPVQSEDVSQELASTLCHIMHALNDVCNFSRIILRVHIDGDSSSLADYAYAN